jgi:tetratricopeptide (TPR) repeat protein
VITFREYIREIENNVEQNLLDQVIAHSSYILKSYPNSIDALRLLGQAYLEEKKYAEALPCFEKVLSFIPDDFVSHVGISSIKEEDRDINSAIFHMELGFDTQPSNNIVQEELKRLIEKRDGTKPPKINLSKGALIRMYMKGELLQQALNEIESALSTSPNRMDLQVLLANVLYSSNSKVQSAETCNQIIERLPYCLEANRILYRIYLENGLQEQASIVKDRLITLNPYYQFVESPKIEVEEIPDEKVELERLSYTSAFSANIEDYIPEVNKTPKEHVFESPPQKLPSIMDEEDPYKSRKDEIFPDFLSNAGWEKTDNPHNEPPELIPESVIETPEIPAEKGPLPDWLENFQLSSEFLEKKSTILPEESIGIINKIENPINAVTYIDTNPSENISSINEVEMSTDTPQSPFEKDESSDWMSQFFDEAKDTSAKSEEDKQLPDWLKSFDQKESTNDDNLKEETPDWLKSLDSDIVGKDEVTSPQPESMTNENKNDEPDWFKSLVSENDSQDETVTNTVASTEQNEIEEQILDPDISSLSYLDSISENNVPETVAPSLSQDEQTSSDNDFLKSLGLSDEQPGLEEPSKIGPNSVEPTSFESIPSELVSSEPTLSETEGSLPDWVKSVLTEPEEMQVIKEPDAEPITNVNESPIVPIVEDFPHEQIDVTIEKSEGAISQETSEELLTWLREISPDSHEESPLGKTENPTIDAVPQITETLEDSLDQLQEISNENAIPPIQEDRSVEIVHEALDETAEQQDIPLPVSTDSVEIPQAIDDTELVIVDLPENQNIEDLLEKLILTVSDGKYIEAADFLPELDKAGIETDEILVKLNALKPERLDDFNFLQFLGDTLAGFGHFEEAMDMYTQAEQILK